MNPLQALLLGLIQGITEFFPISSSAHLKFFRHLLGLQGDEQWLYFDLVCHAGSFLALLWFFKKNIWEVLCKPKEMAYFFLALIPLVPAYFLLKPVRIALSQPIYTGYFLLVTGTLLLIASKLQNIRAINKWLCVLLIGIMQAFALLPGLSRSGLTIAGGKFCGWSIEKSARFSFLLAVPTILGGMILESIKLEERIWSPILTLGFVASLISGLATVKVAFWFYNREKIASFGWYCLGFSLLWIWTFHG